MSATQRVATDPRFSRRRMAVARSRRKRIILRASIAAALALVVWVIVWSPLLRVDDVRVVGARHTSAEEIARVAELDSDDNLLLVSTSQIAERAETLPWVKSAEVVRMLPDTVRVRVVERKPALVLSLGAAHWSIDARGHVLQVGEAEKGLVALSAVEEGSIEPGVRLRSPAITAALRVWRSLPRPLKGKVAALFAPTPERITFALEDGLLVRYGGAHDLVSKNEVLVALLRRIRANGTEATYVDVRAPTSPAVSVPAPPAPVVAPAASPSPEPSPSASASPKGKRAPAKHKNDD